MKYLFIIAFLFLSAIYVEQGFTQNNDAPIVQKGNAEGIGGLLIAQSAEELMKKYGGQDDQTGDTGKQEAKTSSKKSEPPSSSEEKKVWTDKRKADLFVMLGGLILGLLLGVIVQRSQFCMSNAFTFIRIMGSFLKFKSYMVALLVAILGVYLLSMIPMSGEGADVTHLVEPLLGSQPTFLPTADSFNLYGFIIGGFIFGMGIVWAGGCASRILIRTGEGNLGSLISVAAFGMAAGTALQGHVGYLNSNYFQKWSKEYTLWFTDLVGINSDTSFSIPMLLADLFGAKNRMETIEWSVYITPILLGLFAVFLAIWFYKSKDKDDFWGKKWPLTGLGIGLLIVAGWAITGYATTHWNPNEGLMAQDQIAHNSLTFANPNYQFMDYLFKASARFDPDHPITDFFWGEKIGSFLTSFIVTFGVASVIGAVLGSFISAKATKSFSWVIPPDKTAFLGHIVGGIMMGWGAVLSLGCNIGQGLSGISVLGLGGVITVIFIILGSWTTVWMRERWEI